MAFNRKWRNSYSHSENIPIELNGTNSISNFQTPMKSSGHGEKQSIIKNQNKRIKNRLIEWKRKKCNCWQIDFCPMRIQVIRKMRVTFSCRKINLPRVNWFRKMKHFFLPPNLVSNVYLNLISKLDV